MEETMENLAVDAMPAAGGLLWARWQWDGVAALIALLLLSGLLLAGRLGAPARGGASAPRG